MMSYVLQDLFVLCTGQRGESNGDVVGLATPASFRFLMVALISAIPTGMQYFSWFTIFLVEAILVASTWPFSP